MSNYNKRLLHFFNKLNKVYEEADNAFRAIFNRHRSEVKCKKGCYDCCYAVFDVSLIEGLFIRHLFELSHKKIKKQIRKNAQRTIKEYEGAYISLQNEGTDPSMLRIKCPLLSADYECLLYKARPINCRTYGVPTMFKGSSHVCFKSGFKMGQSYTTLNLEAIHNRLMQLSLELKGTPLGLKRYPIPHVILLKI